MEKWSGSDAPKTTPCYLREPTAGLLNQHEQRASQKRSFAGCMQKVLHIGIQNLELACSLKKFSFSWERRLV